MKKILVIDDDMNILDVINLILTGEGYDVKTLTSGRDMKAIKSFMPDVILLDVLLSGEDGRMLAQKLKNDSKMKEIPIIMISAHPTAGKNYTAYQADGFLPKPFNIEYLLDTIRQYISAP